MAIIYALGSASLWYDTTATYSDDTINARLSDMMRSMRWNVPMNLFI
jgi:hypothetical protein